MISDSANYDRREGPFYPITRGGSPRHGIRDTNTQRPKIRRFVGGGINPIVKG